MTRRLTQEYLANRTFYQIQAGSLIDNPDQRISADVRCGFIPATRSCFAVHHLSSPGCNDQAHCHTPGSSRTQHWASP